MKNSILQFTKGVFLDAPLQLGFDSWGDFAGSLFNKTMLLFTVKWALIFGGLSAQVEQWVGLPIALFIGFILLIFGEGYTGIKASLKEGEKIQSRKIGRLSTKVFLFSAMLFVLNLFKGEPITIGTIQIAFYSWVYWTVFHIISIQLIISILENLSRMGYKETSLVMKLVKGRLKHYLDLDKKQYTAEVEPTKVDTPKVEVNITENI